jgi:hypothetical protein
MLPECGSLDDVLVMDELESNVDDLTEGLENPAFEPPIL